MTLIYNPKSYIECVQYNLIGTTFKYKKGGFSELLIKKMFIVNNTWKNNANAKFSYLDTDDSKDDDLLIIHEK